MWICYSIKNLSKRCSGEIYYLKGDYIGNDEMESLDKKLIPMYSLLVVFLASILTSLVYLILSCLGVDTERKFPTGFIVYVSFVCLTVAIVVSILKTRGWKMSDVGFKRPDRNMMLVGLLFLAIGMIVVFPITVLINQALDVEMKGIDYTINSVGDVLVAVLACSVIGPLGEEIIFRGFLIKVAQQKITNRMTVGILALLSFTVIHIPFGVAGMIFITLWAILPIFLFMHYDNIYPGYLMHALGNLWAFLFVPLLFE